MASKQILAFDLGAESGRAILGSFDGAKLQLDVLHRFPNGPMRAGNAIYWDALRLFDEMKTGLRSAASKHGTIDSLGVDAWGVDFAFLGRDGSLLGNPRHYRDPHTETIMEQAFQRVPRAEIFRHTGLQFMRFNTLFQLLALQRDHALQLETAHLMLFIPDLFHFWFTDIVANEFSIASTSQCYDPTTKQWAWQILDRFQLKRDLFGDILQPGAQLGTLTQAVADECGTSRVPVILPATHDTGSAVAAVPAEGQSWCYISSGTWSLMGAEIQLPIINDQVQHFNFTNEGGVGGTIRFLKNIMGLWLVQECKRAWERAGQTYSYDELTRLAEAAQPFVSIIDPDDPSFWLPANMPDAIAAFCRKTNQTEPKEPGAVVRCALESLALRYRWVLDRLEELLGRRLDVIHIVGGGSQNQLLNQFTADACNRVVLAGPVETTAIGNVMVQTMGLGLVGSLAEARQVVRRSFDVQRFEPRAAERWSEAIHRFDKLFAPNTAGGV